MLKERKQVLKVGDKISSLSNTILTSTPKLANGSLHGLIGDLTMNGTNYV